MPKIINLERDFELALVNSIEILNDGGVIVFPTDTVYGLAAKFDNLLSVQRIFLIKDRSQTKALPIIIGDINQVDEVSDRVTNVAKKLMRRYWPGALTIILKKKNTVSTLISMDNSVGVRIPDDNFVQNLAKSIGPLATTSANKSGFPSTTNVADVQTQLGDLVDLIIDGGESFGGIPSTVVDCQSETIKLLRHGAISEGDIRKILKSKHD